MQKTLGWVACGLSLAGALMVSAPRDVQARPNYLGEFKKVYEKLATEADKAKCGICHYGESKKNLNDYGTTLGKALDAKNVKDAAKIAEALKKIEAEKSKTEGKTFGDLLKEGKLPGKSPE